MQSHSNNQRLNSSSPADLISIDPGFRYFGYSIFSENKIIYADLSKVESDQWEAWEGQPPLFTHLKDIVESQTWSQRKAVIEFPQVYQETPNPNDIVKLASACGAYTAILQSLGFEVIWVKPKEWKGTVPKDVMLKRILAKIEESEYPCIMKPKDHNVIDAIGVGLWRLNRKKT